MRSGASVDTAATGTARGPVPNSSDPFPADPSRAWPWASDMLRSFFCCVQHFSRKARGGFWLVSAAKGRERASALLIESAVDALSVLTRPPPGSDHALVVCTAVPKWLDAFGLTRVDCGFHADDTGNRAADALAHRDMRAGRLRTDSGAKGWNDRIRKQEARTEPA